MAISYHVYANDGQGGPVDYTRPIATVALDPSAAAGSFLTAPLAAPSDNLFAVRAFDDASGVEEANTDARVRVVIDDQGRDVSSRPNPVVGLAARWTVGDVALISWGYSTAGQGGMPTRFDVTASPATAGADAPAPARLSVACLPGVAGYGCRFEGLSCRSDWAIAVVAVGATDAVAAGPVATRLGGQAGVLAPVDGLTATASP